MLLGSQTCWSKVTQCLKLSTMICRGMWKRNNESQEIEKPECGRIMQLYNDRTAQVGKKKEQEKKKKERIFKKVPQALAEILVELHTLNLTLSCT